MKRLLIVALLGLACTGACRLEVRIDESPDATPPIVDADLTLIPDAGQAQAPDAQADAMPADAQAAAAR